MIQPLTPMVTMILGTLIGIYVYDNAFNVTMK